MEKKILVTGANGFIGQNCLMLLMENSGYDVFACCHHLPAVKMPGIHYIECDLTNEESMEKALKDISASHLLHLAWYVEPGRYMHSKQNVKWLCCSLKLIQLFVKYGGKRVVTAGTCAEYDWKSISVDGIISEDFSANNNSSLYSSAKSALGNMAYAYMKEYGLSAAHGRIFYLFGPGENTHRLIPSAITLFKNKKAIELKNGLYVRDYLYVKDVASAFIKILFSEAEGAVNIGSGEGKSLFELLECVENMMEVDGLIKVNDTVNASEPMRIIANTNKLKLLGWTRKYSMEEALREYCELMRCVKKDGAYEREHRNNI